jgi:uncharacterized protein YkwD
MIIIIVLIIAIGFYIFFTKMRKIKKVEIIIPPKMDYVHTTEELELIKLINDYRVSVNLNILEVINHISYKCEEHNIDMIVVGIASHNGFVTRSEDITKVLGCKTVGENVAYNFKTPQGVLNAWLNSTEHKKNIEGKFTHTGLSTREDSNGKKYYTNIFVLQ